MDSIQFGSLEKVSMKHSYFSKIKNMSVSLAKGKALVIGILLEYTSVKGDC